MQINRNVRALILDGEDDDQLVVRWDNRGEPYREGLTLEVNSSDYQTLTSIFISQREALALRDKLNEIFP